MTALKETLENFQSYILENNSAIEKEITEEGKASVDTRLKVYGNAYYLRLIEVLEDDFPILSKTLGKDKFSQLARDYTDAYPSNHYSVGAFSRHFSKFLSTNTSLDPIYSELANLEWHLGEVIYAADAPVLTLEDLKLIPPDEWIELKLTFHPSVRVLTLFYNAAELYKTINEKLPQPSIKQIPNGEDWLVWRKDQHAFFCSLTHEEAWICQAIQRGSDFGDICEGLCDFLPEESVSEFAATTLSKWISEGIFSR